MWDKEGDVKREKMNINALKEMLHEDPKTLELLEFLDDCESIIESDDDNRGFRLPYSSDPSPIGERWKTA